MDEDTNTIPPDATLNGVDPKPATGTTVTDATSEATTGTPPTDLQEQIKRLETALKKANADAKSHRLKADELDRLKAEQETATLNETQKLQKQLAKMQADHDTLSKSSQERIINYEVRLQAAQAGIVDPDAAAKLLDWSQIEYDDHGQPTNVEKLLKDLLKAKPYLVGKPVATGGGATNPPRSATDGTGEITEQYAMDVLSGKIKGLSAQQTAKVGEWLASQQFGSFSKRRNH